MNVSKPRYENYIEQDFRMIIKIKLLFRCHEKYVEKNTNLERWRQLEGGDMIINIIRGNKFKLSVIRMINVGEWFMDRRQWVTRRLRSWLHKLIWNSLSAVKQRSAAALSCMQMNVKQNHRRMFYIIVYIVNTRSPPCSNRFRHSTLFFHVAEIMIEEHSRSNSYDI